MLSNRFKWLLKGVVTVGDTLVDNDQMKESDMLPKIKDDERRKKRKVHKEARALKDDGKVLPPCVQRHGTYIGVKTHYVFYKQDCIHGEAVLWAFFEHISDRDTIAVESQQLHAL